MDFYTSSTPSLDDQIAGSVDDGLKGSPWSCHSSQRTRDSKIDYKYKLPFEDDAQVNMETSTAAIKFYESLMETKAMGIDVGDSLAASYSNVDWCQFIPRNEQGQLLSVGSIPHLLDPCGSSCKPCGCFPRGKCYKGAQCLHCHFFHPRRDRTQNSSDAGGKKESSLARRARRQRSEKRKDEGLKNETPVLLGGHIRHASEIKLSTSPNCKVYGEWSSLPVVPPRLPSSRVPWCNSTEEENESSVVTPRFITSTSASTCTSTPRALTPSCSYSRSATPPPEELEVNYCIHPDLLPWGYYR